MCICTNHLDREEVSKSENQIVLYPASLPLEQHCNDSAATWWLAHERDNWGLYSTSCYKPRQCKILCLRTFLSWTSVDSHWSVAVVHWDSLLFEHCHIQTWPSVKTFYYLSYGMIIRNYLCKMNASSSTGNGCLGSMWNILMLFRPFQNFSSTI